MMNSGGRVGPGALAGGSGAVATSGSGSRNGPNGRGGGCSIVAILSRDYQGF
jgi:hypothetical protein